MKQWWDSPVVFFLSRFLLGVFIGLIVRSVLIGDKEPEPYSALVTVELEEVKLFCTSSCKFIILANMQSIAKDDGDSQIGWPGVDSNNNKWITFNVTDSRMNLLLSDENPTCIEATGPKICTYQLSEQRVYSFSIVEKQDPDTGLWERHGTPN